jgi:3D (Asp-Asp-Asp) domain-containing protein
MKYLQKLSFLWPVFVILTATSSGNGSGISPYFEFSKQNTVITNVLATGYYCVYNSEIDGRQTVNITISNNSYALYIKYTGGAACFVHLTGVNAGRNPDGQWVVSPRVLRNRYAHLGITDFTGFGNLALLYPARATFSTCEANTGSSGQLLNPWSSIAVDTSVIPLGQTFTMSSKNEGASLYSGTNTVFRADDTGGFIKGRRIDIYLGEGEAAWEQWLQSGGNRYVDIYLTR